MPPSDEPQLEFSATAFKNLFEQVQDHRGGTGKLMLTLHASERTAELNRLATTLPLEHALNVLDGPMAAELLATQRRLVAEALNDFLRESVAYQLSRSAKDAEFKKLEQSRDHLLRFANTFAGPAHSALAAGIGRMMLAGAPCDWTVEKLLATIDQLRELTKLLAAAAHRDAKSKAALLENVPLRRLVRRLGAVFEGFGEQITYPGYDDAAGRADENNRFLRFIRDCLCTVLPLKEMPSNEAIRHQIRVLIEGDGPDLEAAMEAAKVQIANVNALLEEFEAHRR